MDQFRAQFRLFIAISLGLLTLGLLAGHPSQAAAQGPVLSPRRYLLQVRHPPSPVVALAVHRPAPVAPVRVVVDSHAAEAISPYDRGGIVIAGAGASGVFLFGDSQNVAAAYRLHLGLAVGAAGAWSLLAGFFWFSSLDDVLIQAS